MCGRTAADAAAHKQKARPGGRALELASSGAAYVAGIPASYFAGATFAIMPSNGL